MDSRRPARSLRPLAVAASVALLLIVGSVGAQSTVSHPYQGITYIEATSSLPRPVRMHIVQVDLSAPGIRLKLTPPSGERETTRQTTAEFVREEHAQVGINGHFFLPFPSTDKTAWLIGLAASEGRIYSSCETPEQNYALVADAPAINIDRANHASVVHCDPSSPDRTRIRERAELWTTISGSAQIVTDGGVTIPQYRDSQHPDAALTPGSARNYATGNSWYDVVTARSAIGLSKDGRTLTLFTVDARGGSDGMKVPEVADLLITNCGVWNALNVDGGGSTSLAMADPATGVVKLANASSANPAGRSVGSSLAVFALKREDPDGR